MMRWCACPTLSVHCGGTRCLQWECRVTYSDGYSQCGAREARWQHMYRNLLLHERTLGVCFFGEGLYTQPTHRVYFSVSSFYCMWVRRLRHVTSADGPAGIFKEITARAIDVVFFGLKSESSGGEVKRVRIYLTKTPIHTGNTYKIYK